MSIELEVCSLKLRDKYGTIYEPSVLHGKTAETIYDCAKAGGSTETEAAFMTRFARSLNPYPVGAIYISNLSTSPASLFGGSWTQLKDTFLFCRGPLYEAGSIPAGEAEHVLTIDEMPAHTHTWVAAKYSGTDSGVGTYRPGVSKYEQKGTLSSSYTGGDAAHNNMPPFVAKYMWKRVS